jgi:restriction system protein
MARRRGFFAEMQYQAQLAERRSRQQDAAAYRAHTAAQREAERLRKGAERARATAARASAAEKRKAEQFAARLHADARQAEVAALNADLANSLNEIDSLLAGTLAVDDFVDLEALKITKVEHPSFEPGRLADPVPTLPALVYPPEPTYAEPPPPSGLASALGGKKKHQQAVARARSDFERERQEWHQRATAMHARYVADTEQRQQKEEERVQKLAAAERAYEGECRLREEEAKQRNEELSRLINDLAFDVESAIEEYVGIVLSNSVYPDAFPVSYDHEFALGTRELTLLMTVPEPAKLPSVKEYRYVKSKDEITSTALSAKAQKDRYANAVWQVALRSLHEVFEADRAGKVRSIALTVGVDTIAPATGQAEYVPLAIVAADRETFNSFDLANVVPQATLTHLGASMSKLPFDLVPTDTSRGVRARGQA